MSQTPLTDLNGATAGVDQSAVNDSGSIIYFTTGTEVQQLVVVIN